MPGRDSALVFFKPSAVLCVLCVSNFNAEDAEGRGGKAKKNLFPTKNAKEKRIFPCYPAVSGRFSFAARPFWGT